MKANAAVFFSKFTRFFSRGRFLKAWSVTLADNAALFSGLYSGLVRVESGQAKAPHKILKEWYDRTRFKWENSEITKLCDKTMKPAIEQADPTACASWAALLLKAAENAGIRREIATTLVLDAGNTNAYTEWNGETLYEGDTVAVINPAWVQSGKLIESGSCTLTACGEE